MSLRTTITMTQTQKLVMTPKLQQAIKILQMPRLELAQYVSQQLVENPVLEESYDEPEDVGAEDEGADEAAGSEDETLEADIDLETGLPDETEVASEEDSPELDITDDDFGDADWEEYFADSATSSNNEWEAPLDDDNRDTLADAGESLEEHLLWQLKMIVESKEDYTIGEAVIGNMDDDGYLTVSVEDIAEQLECEAENVDQILQLVQTFDPAGVGARDLKECLLIQLEQLGLVNTVAYEIVEDGHLQDLENNRFPQIAKALKVELELVRAAADAISSLEPRPGRLFSAMKTEYVIPDVTVVEVDGEYRVLMNEYGLSLGVSQHYRRMWRSRASLSNEVRDYIKTKMQSATWIIDSIERRRRTILRVTESIFEVQRDFLDRGPSYLKPLTLKQIAERVDISESTVSRVTRNRYVQTPRGVFELKYFFTSGISTENGGMASSLSVKEIIKDMVDKEDTKAPLSDKDIELQLKEKGFQIARRTINKYRKELNIPNSSKRKKW
ncbi:RNA polymerase factor sigma-54 [Candidatus Poribacteria bacterium]